MLIKGKLYRLKTHDELLRTEGVRPIGYGAYRHSSAATSLQPAMFDVPMPIKIRNLVQIGPQSSYFHHRGWCWYAWMLVEVKNNEIEGE